uniref:C2H2-type domain-containing protein n=1 Tax=Serinus canaria TaxID=9135 RepID=A0A8C9U2B4_SERCA
MLPGVPGRFFSVCRFGSCRTPRLSPLGGSLGVLVAIAQYGQGRTLVLGTPGEQRRGTPGTPRVGRAERGDPRAGGSLAGCKGGEPGEEGPLGSQSRASGEKGPHGPTKAPGISLSGILEKGEPLEDGIGQEKPLLQDSPTLVFPKSGSVIPKLWSDGGGGKAPEIPHEEGLQTQPRELQGGKSSLSQEGVRRCSWSSELVEKPHGREKAHKCLECGKGFSRSSTLMEHQNIHIGERSCECGECGKSFSGSSDLTKDHKIHTGKRWNSEIVTHHAWNVRRASGGIQRSSLTSTSTPGRGPASVPSVGRASCAAPAPSPMGGSALDDPQ